MSLLKDLINEAVDNADDFDMQSVLSKLKSAEKSETVSKDSVAFALEEIDKNSGQSRIVKVYVSRDQANDFETALAAALDEYGGEKEIAEILFDLREKFNIVNVEWPDIPEDEEVDQSLEGGADQVPGEGDQMQADVTAAPDAGVADETDAKSALQAVIDMMKADASARQAEAEARKAEAEARSAELAATASVNKAKTEEQILDMEAYYKEKETKKKEAEQLAKLAKYKHDLAKDAETQLDNIDTTPASVDVSTQKSASITAPEDEEIRTVDNIPVTISKDRLLKNREFLKYVEQFLKHNVRQD